MQRSKRSQRIDYKILSETGKIVSKSTDDISTINNLLDNLSIYDMPNTSTLIAEVESLGEEIEDVLEEFNMEQADIQTLKVCGNNFV